MNFLHRIKFHYQCKKILKTMPLASPIHTVSIVSMVCHDELCMYLVSVKSLVHYLKFLPKIYVLNDGSLTLDDKMALSEHIKDIVICSLSAIEVPEGVPIGGTWERLLLIAKLCEESYVIQLDSDTVTLDTPIDIARYIDHKRNFTLADSRKVTDIFEDKSLEKIASHDSQLVKGVFERNVGLGFRYLVRYVCGNSGFAGFCKEAFTVRDVEAAARIISEVCGDKIHEWGSEQVASNMLVCKKDVTVLSDSYSLYLGENDIFAQGTIDMLPKVFLHFIGRHRFENNTYVRAITSVIRVLKKADHVKKGTQMQSDASRMRGEGSRLQAEGSRLCASGIDHLIDRGELLKILGKITANKGDKLFAEGTALLSKEQ